MVLSMQRKKRMAYLVANNHLLYYQMLTAQVTHSPDGSISSPCQPRGVVRGLLLFGTMQQGITMDPTICRTAGHTLMIRKVDILITNGLSTLQ